MSTGIAIYSGDVTIYWSAIVIALAVAACFALSYALYTSYAGNGKVMWVVLPIAIFFSVIFCRLIHWYCHEAQYLSLWKALTDYTTGGYCLPGAILGTCLAAWLAGKMGFTDNVPRLLDAIAPGGALCIALIRLSSLFNTSCRSKIIITTPALQHLPLASQVYANGGADYRFATFFVEFLIMLIVLAMLCKFYDNKRSAHMKKGQPESGHVARMFLLIYSAVEIVMDSTRYDSSYMHFNGFVSIVQIFAALSILGLIAYYSVYSIRANRFKFYHVCLWVAALLGLGCAGGAEYMVQRHGDWYLPCYGVMSIGAIGMALVVYKLYKTCCEDKEWKYTDDYSGEIE